MTDPMVIGMLPCGEKTLELGNRTLIMGIVNVTPDSFSDGGSYFSTEKAVAHALQLADEGADLLDIGGESTRPFSEPVSEAEELSRVIPIIEKISPHVEVPISIDTTKASVAQKAIAAGAALINDVSALRMDPEMASVAAGCRVPLILMHMKGSPKTMQVDPVYDDLIPDIKNFLSDAMDRAMAAGVDRSMLVVDPGIGFGKTVDHNLQILNDLENFHQLGAPLLVGSSRKMFIRQLVKAPEEKDIDPRSVPVARGTQAAIAIAAMKGAHIVRVHDVARTRETLAVVDAVSSVR